MPPMMFMSLIGLLFNLLFAGALPSTIHGANKLDGVARVTVSASVNS
jgi:hypothetical protein